MLSTIGYENASLSDFVQSLRSSGVELLVDIRKRAQSRRKGFSKTALSDALEQAGIEYVHFRVLGDPKDGREAARSGNMALFRAIYRSVLQSPSAQNAIAEIAALSKHKHLCLMCYEQDHLECHRKMVADCLERMLGRKFCHLRVLRSEKIDGQKGRMLHRHQSAAA